MKTPHGGYIEWIPSATGKRRISEQEFIGKTVVNLSKVAVRWMGEVKN